MKNLLKNQKGFTLIELMVVVFIVAILAALAIPSYFRNVQKARATEAQTALRAFSTAYETYKMQYGAVENYEKEDALKDAGIRESVIKKWEFEPNLNGNKLVSVTATSTSEFDGGEGHEIVFDVEEGVFSGWGIDSFGDDDDN